MHAATRAMSVETLLSEEDVARVRWYRFLARVFQAAPDESLLASVAASASPGSPDPQAPPLALAWAPTLGYDPRLGLSVIPIFLAMVLLAIPPILVAAFSGLREVDRDLVESARGMGMQERQILLDIEMPGIDGFELCRTLRRTS